MAALLLAVGCGSEATRLEWVIRFADSEVQARAAVVVAEIRRGGCDGPVTYTAELAVAGGSMPAQPPELTQGRYGAVAQAYSTDCVVVAEACRVVDLPGDGGTLLVEMAEVTNGLAACAAEVCNGLGHCAIDAGMIDEDGGTIETDAGPPPEECTDEGQPCPSGGTCRSGLCCNGCWNGSTCLGGQAPAACGEDGAMCSTCDPGAVCRGAVCTTPVGAHYSLSAVGSFLRVGDGRLYSAGSDGDQQRGPRDNPTAMGFLAYNGATRFAQVATTQFATCGITDEGHLMCWGTNRAGLLGLGRSTFDHVEAAPTRVGLERWSLIEAGDAHICAIKDTGGLFCWGSNSSSQLGLGDTSPRPAPTAVLAGATFVHVSCGAGHTCAIRDDGALFCWGLNDLGQVGVAAAGSRPPERIGTDSDWLAVSAGVSHSCGIRGAAGNLFCWGAGGAGQLGLGDDVDHNQPMAVGTGIRWVAIAAGQFHTCGLFDDGGRTAACWGFGGRGALGLGHFSDQRTPSPLSGTTWESIAVGWTHSCGVRDGGYYCWGDDSANQLGVAAGGDKNEPTAGLLVPAP